MKASVLVLNSNVERAADYPPALTQIIGNRHVEAARAEFATWQGYAPTPLVSAADLARSVGVGHIVFKDETRRMGLGSFKAMGAPLAAVQAIGDCLDLPRDGLVHRRSDLEAPAVRSLLARTTIVTASDGNHGRSVAWAARELGCRCFVYLHEGVSKGREQAILEFGARTIRVPGNYDDSVAAVASDAQVYGWLIVSDTSYPGYTAIPQWVMRGYAVMAAEIVDAWDQADPPTHVFVQSGCGGLAAAVLSEFWRRWGALRPRLIIVEPHNAAPLLESARACRTVRVEGDLETVMSGLACGEVSTVAWDILSTGADAFLSIDDAHAKTAMRTLAANRDGVPRAVGDTGGAGLAGLMAAREDPGISLALGLDASSSVLLLLTETVIDIDGFRSIVGCHPDDLAAAGPA